jgi:hypothetical protein
VSIQKYVDLYGGIEYVTHYKHSKIMLTMFICLIFGTGIPLLYPIALLSVLIEYLLERYLLAYYYKLPKIETQVILTDTLNVLKFAAVCSLGVNYWMMSNPQMFSNQVFPVTHVDSPENTNHSIFAFQVDHSLPSLIISLFLAFSHLSKCIMRIAIFFDKHHVGNNPLNSKNPKPLPSFYDSLSNYDLKCWVQEEDHVINKCKFRTLIKESYEKLQHTLNSRNLNQNLTPKLIISNIFCYDILVNPEYASAFQYFRVNERDGKSDEVFECDIIKKIETQIKNINKKEAIFHSIIVYINYLSREEKASTKFLGTALRILDRSTSLTDTEHNSNSHS